MEDVRLSNRNLQRERTILRFVKALTSLRQYKAALKAAQICVQPFDFLKRYGLKSGDYPAQVFLRSPIGNIGLYLYSWHDARTVHEIFISEDYKIDNNKRIIVDYGSNIGISAAYFISRNENSFIYLHEPVPRNIGRLKTNLHDFEGRYRLEEVAVGLSDGNVKFGIEDSGRYGGINLYTGREIDVECRDSNKLLAEIIERHGKIDVLKIDVETMERALVEYLTPELASKIDLILVEARFEKNLLAATHTESVQGTITRYERIA
jgi:FkbM family methyltransferase